MSLSLPMTMNRYVPVSGVVMPMVGILAVSALVKARPGVTDLVPKMTSSLVVTAGTKPGGVCAEARAARLASEERMESFIATKGPWILQEDVFEAQPQRQQAIAVSAWRAGLGLGSFKCSIVSASRCPVALVSAGTKPVKAALLQSELIQW